MNFSIEQQNEISQIIKAELDARLAGVSLKGHRHDGFDEMRVVLSLLDMNTDGKGRVPLRYKYASETSSDTLGAKADLISVTITPHSTSNILVIAFVQVNNDAGTARDLTWTLERGSTTLATAQSYLPAVATSKGTVCFFAIESPNAREPITYDLTGATGAGSPTATNKAILAIELPHRKDTTE